MNSSGGGESSEVVSLEKDQVLGNGCYGIVCKAKKGQLSCAAKLLHDSLFEGEGTDLILAEEFRKECQILSEQQHPNIVQYLGTSIDPASERLVLLMELMGGSLTTYLDRSTGLVPYYIQLNICHDVALALSYLHSKGIIHSGLSSNNVLLTKDSSQAKVADFRMSRLVEIKPETEPSEAVCSGAAVYMPPETEPSVAVCSGAAVYMPPEAPSHYTSKLDCFSLGVLIIQIITKNTPDPSESHCGQNPVPEVVRRERDINLIKRDHPLRAIAISCLEDDKTKRPSAGDLCESFSALKNEKEYKDSKEGRRDIGFSALSAGAIGGAIIGGTAALGLAVVAAPVALTTIGFSTGGVVAGSLAAVVHSAIGNVATGSVFATLQSIGAVGGLSAAATAATASVGTAAGAVTGVAIRLRRLGI